MAVKVMVAPSIISGQVSLEKRAQKLRVAGAEAKPRRRRSAVYDADGSEVFITMMCLKCHKTRPLAAFGLRKMADGAIRNQPWCRTCRSGAGHEVIKETDPIETVEAPPEAIEASDLLAAEADRVEPVSGGLVAAEVAAALAAGANG